MSEPTSEGFREVMSRFATGVAVMTTVADGVPHGMTANAITSVSLDPLLVLVCVEKTTAMAPLVQRSKVFALSILGHDQQQLSVFFADPERPMGAQQFVDVPHRAGATGSPLLQGCLGWLDCEVWASYDGGDHDIVVGRVVSLELGDDGDALLYLNHAYRAACEPQRQS